MPSIGLAAATHIRAIDGRACGIRPEETDGVERVELDTPREAIQGAGGETEPLSLKAGEIRAHHNDLESAGGELVADAPRVGRTPLGLTPTDRLNGVRIFLSRNGRRDHGEVLGSMALPRLGRLSFLWQRHPGDADNAGR
jgi:hypothetical protein